jgi:putative transcriptional regulator
MIEVTIRERAVKNGYTTAYQLQKALNVQPSVAARLYKGKFTKISLDTLDKLCHLFDCQPNQLFKYVRDE